MKQFITSKQILDAVANTPQVVFEVTDACNLQCRYCLYGDLYTDYGKRHDKYLSPELAIRFLDNLISIWESNRNHASHRFTYISFYGGEPLLNMPFIKDVVNHLNARRHQGLDHEFGYTMTTNGLLLDRHIDFFIDNSFDILISLDGNKRNNSYRTFKGGAESFDRLSLVLKKIKGEHPDYFESHVSFNSVLHDRNSTSETVAYIRSEYGKVPTVSELNPSGVNIKMTDTFNKLYRQSEESVADGEKIEGLVEELGSKSKTYREMQRYIRCHSQRYHEDYLQLLRNGEPIRLPTGTCIPFSRKIFVTVDGKILPCERIPHDYTMGTIDTENQEIDYELSADIYNTMLNRVQSLCGHCFNRKECVQCVYAIEKEDIGKRCGGFMSQSAFQQYEDRMLGCISRHPDLYRKIMEESIVI